MTLPRRGERHQEQATQDTQGPISRHLRTYRRLFRPGVDPGAVRIVGAVNGFHRDARLREGKDMAKYMLLIYGDEEQWGALTPEQRRAHDAAHAGFRAAAGDRIIGGAELEPAPVATTLRAGVDDDLVTTDGPFLEPKEALGGYYLMEAGDLDEVLQLASLLPEVRAGHSGVEIRPLVDHG